MDTNLRASPPALLPTYLLVGLLSLYSNPGAAADKLIGLHSAQVMSQSMPWIAQEAGLFKKYDLDFRLVFIPSSPVATAATLNGDAEIGVTGAVGNVRAYVQGFTDLVFIGGIKNILTHSVLGKPDIKRPEDLKGKKVAVGRFGGNTHYFVIQALKRLGMDAGKDIQTIQTGGGPETLAALVGGSVDAAGLSRRAMPLRYPAGFAMSSTDPRCAFRMAPRNWLRFAR
jgi:ABC-type nitrate/sulfonate/bicarbonate transport system substrate-binding protein